jgi:molybdate transport system ATP-binding protein
MLSAHLIKKLRDFTLDVTLSVHNGEVLVLIGENGAGKSTILNLLAGLLSPDNGEIILCDRQLYAHATGVSLPSEER